MSDSAITIFQFLSAEAISQNSSVTFDVEQKRYSVEGFFSLQIRVQSAGAGTVTVTYACSNDGTNFVTPVGATAIFTTFGKTDGGGSNGRDLQSFDPPVCKFLRIIVTEDNVAAVTVDAQLAIQ
ncbi:MAG: hypothetical protein ACYSWP_04555 [Planctomycetota bacterium]|jgi:hypothetical protein